MKRQQPLEEESLDFLSPSFDQYHMDDWMKSGVELEATEISQTSTFFSQHGQRNTIDSKTEWTRHSIEHTTKDYNSVRGTLTSINTNNDCCAFRKLEEVLRIPGEKQDTLSRKGPCHRLITWVSICRDEDADLDYKVKRSCPLAKCTFSCDPNDGDLIRHILSCSFLKYGKYKCPYHNNESEAFMLPQQRRSRKRWSRNHSVREAFRDICKLGSKGLHKAFGHSSKRRRSEDSETINSDHSEISAFEIDGSSQVYVKKSTNNQDLWPEKRQPPARRSQALQPQIQSQIREADDTAFINELGVEFCSELPGQDIDLYSELPSIRFSTVQEEPSSSLAANANSTAMDIDNSLPSPLSPTYVSSDRFESPISPEEVQGVVRWAEAVESTSGHQVSLDAVVFGWPMDQRQSLQTIPPMSMARSPNVLLRAKGLKTIKLDTSVGGAKPVLAPKALTPVSPMERFPSSPDNPEVLSQEPTKFFEELRSTVQNTYTFTYAQLSRPPQLPISEEIIAKQLTPAKVFLSGWEAVEKVLNGQLPAKFWWLFSLAQLAFACGQVVWEGELKHQLDDVVDDLKNWSFALRSPRERQCYLDVIEQIFINEERKSAATTLSGSPTSASSRSHRDILCLDGQQLLAKLRNGAVVRLCLQFLSTFEFLTHRLDRINNASINGLASLLQTTDANDHNVAILDATIIRPLLAKSVFHELGPVIEKASDLLYDYPKTSIRELELYLVCYARYYTKDHTLHLQFRNAVADCCVDAALQMPEEAEQYLIQENYLLQDIMAIRQSHEGLSATLAQRHNAAPRPASLQVQELQGTPVISMPQQTISPTQPKYELPMQYQYRPHSYIQTPISASTASPMTAMSSGAPSIWTPISAHSISPATATETTFPSPYTSVCWPSTTVAQETSYMHPNFPLPMTNEYSMLANEFLNNDPSLFEEGMQASTGIDLPVTTGTDTTTTISPTVSHIPSTTNMDLPSEVETTKASLSCHICGTTFNGKEQFLASNLRRHMRELHSVAVKGLTCKVCKKPFTRKHNLNVHLKTVHAGVRA